MKTTKQERTLLVGEVSRVVFVGASTVAATGFELPLRVVDLAKGTTQREIKGATGRLAAAGATVFCGQKTLAAFDTTTGKKLAAFKGHSNDVLALAVSPDGATLASGSHDNTLRLWRTRDGAPLHKIRNVEKHSVGGVAFSPDGKLVLATSQSGILRAYDLASGAVRFEVSIREDASWEPPHLAMGPDGLCYVAEEDARDLDVPRVTVWKAATRVASLPLTDGKELLLRSLACSPDGRWLAASSWRNENSSQGKRMSVEVWNLKARSHALRVVVPKVDRVYGVSFSPDSGTLVGGTSDGLVAISLPT